MADIVDVVGRSWGGEISEEMGQDEGGWCVRSTVEGHWCVWPCAIGVVRVMTREGMRELRYVPRIRRKQRRERRR